MTHYATVYHSCPVGLPATIAYPGYDDGCITDADIQIDPALATEIQQVSWSVVQNYAWSGVR